jgi:hypothetical protein
MVSNGGGSDGETWIQNGMDIIWSEIEVLLHEFERAVSMQLREMLDHSVSSIQEKLKALDDKETELQKQSQLMSPAKLQKTIHEMNTKRKEVGDMIVAWNTASKELLQVLSSFEAALKQTQSLLETAVKMLQLLSTDSLAEDLAIEFIQHQARAYADRFEEKNLLSIDTTNPQEEASHLLEVPLRMARYLRDLAMAISLLPPEVALSQVKQGSSGESFFVLEMLKGNTPAKRGLFDTLSEFEKKATELIIQAATPSSTSPDTSSSSPKTSSSSSPDISSSSPKTSSSSSPDTDRKSTRLNSSHFQGSRMPSSA